MTDQPPEETPVDDIIVTGQTRRGPSPYASLNWPTKGQSPRGPRPREVPPEDPWPPPATDEEVACRNPRARQRWNADAKAKAAIQAFLDAAQQRYSEDLQNREFGALICGAADGSVYLSGISDGAPILDSSGNAIAYPNGRPSVGIPSGACVNGTPLGSVHSHPGVNAGIPSRDDFRFTQYLVDNNGANAATVGLYVIASYADGNGGYQNHVTRASLDEKDASQEEGYQSAFVDPNAQPCSAQS